MVDQEIGRDDVIQSCQHGDEPQRKVLTSCEINVTKKSGSHPFEGLIYTAEKAVK